MKLTPQQLMATSWCVFCYPTEDTEDKTVATVVFRGMSLCDSCFKDCFKSEKKIVE